MILVTGAAGAIVEHLRQMGCGNAAAGARAAAGRAVAAAVGQAADRFAQSKAANARTQGRHLASHLQADAAGTMAGRVQRTHRAAAEGDHLLARSADLHEARITHASIIGARHRA